MRLIVPRKKGIHQVLEFAHSIGMQVTLTQSVTDSFIPGIWIEDSQVFCNPKSVEAIGDILHELGHYATTPPEFRHLWSPQRFDINPTFETLPPLLEDGSENPLFRKLIDGDEQAAIAWSYAAAIKCGIDPDTMHLKKHFDGEWEEIARSLYYKCHAGINNLSHIGMTKREIFPQLIRWIQI